MATQAYPIRRGAKGWNKQLDHLVEVLQREDLRAEATKQLQEVDIDSKPTVDLLQHVLQQCSKLLSTSRK